MKMFYLLLAAFLVAAAPALIVQAKMVTRDIAWNAVPEGMARLLAYNALLAKEARLSHLPEHDGHFVDGRVMGFNASLFAQDNFSEQLTGYATGYKDPEDIEASLQFFAPSLPSPNIAEYNTFESAEEFLSDGADDDLIGVGGDFATVRYNSGKDLKQLQNRGLAMDISEAKFDATPNAEQVYVARLIRRLNRNSLRRSITLLSAAATNTGKVWSTAAGKDPDQDVKSELILAQDTSGIRPNRIGYGETAFDLRCVSHRAQNTAGGYASGAMTPDQVASFLTVDEVKISKERFATSATAATLGQILSNKVLMFYATDEATEEDPTNIKRFTGRVAARHGGGAYAVHMRQVADKGWRIAVEKYELLVITSTLGIRQFTCTAS